MKARDIRKMNQAERRDALGDLQNELMHERGVAAMGGAPPNPGRLRAIRRDIARIQTVDTERRRKRGG